MHLPWSYTAELRAPRQQTDAQFSFSAPVPGGDFEHGTSMRRLFAALFPFQSPAWNSGESTSMPVNVAEGGVIVLATFYISSYAPSLTQCPRRSRTPIASNRLGHPWGLLTVPSVPNFILLLVPSTLEPSSLNTMIAFATGGLLGDVFLHLVPHAFFGEGELGAERSIEVEERRNIVIGCVRYGVHFR